MIELSEEVVRQTAEIMGEHSAAARALKDAEKFKEGGNIVRFLTDRKTIFVFGHLPAEREQGQ